MSENTKYKVVDGSQSAHCCFEATVVDSSKPEMFNGTHYDNRYEPICECFEVVDAVHIANTLNLHDKLAEQNKMLRDALYCLSDIMPMGQNTDGGGYMLILSNDTCRIIKEALNICEM